MMMPLQRPNPIRGQDPMLAPHPKPNFQKPAASTKRASLSKSEKPPSPPPPHANMLQASLTKRKAAKRVEVAAKVLDVPKLKALLQSRGLNLHRPQMSDRDTSPSVMKQMRSSMVTLRQTREAERRNEKTRRNINSRIPDKLSETSSLCRTMISRPQQARR